MGRKMNRILSSLFTFLFVVVLVGAFKTSALAAGTYSIIDGKVTITDGDVYFINTDPDNENSSGISVDGTTIVENGYISQITNITVTGGNFYIKAPYKTGSVSSYPKTLVVSGGNVKAEASCVLTTVSLQNGTLDLGNNNVFTVNLTIGGGIFKYDGEIEAQGVVDMGAASEIYAGSSAMIKVSDKSADNPAVLIVDKSKYKSTTVGNFWVSSLDENAYAKITNCPGAFNSTSNPLQAGYNVKLFAETVGSDDPTQPALTIQSGRTRTLTNEQLRKVEGRTFQYAAKEETTFAIQSIERVYYIGWEQSFDAFVKNYIKANAGYDGTVAYTCVDLMYLNQEVDMTRIPEYSRYERRYGVKVYAPETTNYQDAAYPETGYIEFNVKFLPTPSGDMVSLEGVKNGKYAKDAITLTAREGYTMNFRTMGDDALNSFSQKKTITEDMLASFNHDLDGITFKRTSDGAETDESVRLLTVFPDLQSITFDAQKPSLLSAPVVDGKKVEIADDDEITGEKVELTIIDENLNRIEDSEGNVYTEENEGIVEKDGILTTKLVFKVDKNKSKIVGFVATDRSGNEYTLAFRLTHPEKEEKKEEVPEVPKDEAMAKVLLEDQYFGVVYQPKLVTDSDGASKAIFRYRDKHKPYEGYTLVRPTAIGEYTVQAIVPATTKYAATACETDFRIIYLETPEDTFTVSGVKGDHDFYIGKVGLTPAAGFAIATTPSGKFASKLIYNEDVKKVYLSRIKDGATTAAITVDPIKYDDEKPVIFGSATAGLGRNIDLSDGTDIYTDELSFTISDKYLDKVTVNKTDKTSGTTTVDTYAAEDGKCKVRVTSDGGKRDFDVTARDLAGNETKFSFRTKATWLQDKKIPFGSRVSLESGTSYKLGSGTWTVSGDNTLYKGGQDIYVVSSGDYTFNTKQ